MYGVTMRHQPPVRLRHHLNLNFNVQHHQLDLLTSKITSDIDQFPPASRPHLRQRLNPFDLRVQKSALGTPRRRHPAPSALYTSASPAELQTYIELMQMATSTQLNPVTFHDKL
ncbi:hypothetical protein VFPPC_05357 [Pochonia chlamydosporia 170]|uniref:Uncharacterized protein n=1 Tax=Pochonia chlamydosporia 170 TaxID=1380566 RepID=A0A179FEI9_METCM|nr:hypothetical protein VFPPC_05357 [Pochonia chlamydosporia 170]OAQ64005.2 hypothetical protein VFPPC_05357 [Pochonia chlamydosporia 170]